jgi:hypothetical protein
MLTTNSIIVASDQVVSTIVDNEVVILSLHNGHYYGLRGTGSALWQQLRAPIRVHDLADQLAEQYACDATNCLHDILPVLNEMDREGLLTQH